MKAREAGRPREFEREHALRAAVELFWRQGYAATSLDDLLGAMRIGRSSFYGSFGSKHALMLEALELYTSELYARIEAAAQAQPQPARAVLAVMDIAACSELPQHGCFFINSATELMPFDAAVSEIGRRYLARIDLLISTLLGRSGLSRSEARRRSGALLALAAGAIALRKAGEPQVRIRALLDLSPALMAPP